MIYFIGTRRFDMVRIYDLMYQASVCLNNYYGLMILLVLLGCLLHLLVTPYDLYLAFLEKNWSYTFIFLQSIWTFGHIMRLFLIVQPCEQIGNRVLQNFIFLL
ncbi:unnamed protein product [Acanthoscelides obtectus]|uniref:Uncharacterized protein n=1 Tax=Acanthoscelides obtectus TaxID=200917 RepID=A0A9P0PG89_ACAOB|nr:unnamed protein product [Acanthoscelides obtectus]CAK1630430.1 Gustatory receptor for sugar taste 43a [Acanthoscelides obtectus]